MTLLALFRTRLEWCNFTCGYCPWNATVRRIPPEDFRADEARLRAILARVAELPRPVEFFITPKAEYLVLPYWRRAVAELLALPQVRRVTVQTNLSFDLPAFLDEADPGKLALWTTYHPRELEPAQRELLFARWDLLRERSIPFSVGLVGVRENLPEMLPLRQRLDPAVYLWVNPYQREPDYYAPEELALIRSVDPYFDTNHVDFPSRGRPCDAGHRAVYLDDEGDLRRCFFVGDVIGNLFRDGWVCRDEPEPCPRDGCHCYVGHMHIVELGFRARYGDGLAARIPTAWPAALPLAGI